MIKPIEKITEHEFAEMKDESIRNALAVLIKDGNYQIYRDGRYCKPSETRNTWKWVIT